jgi:hypothetical protein
MANVNNLLDNQQVVLTPASSGVDARGNPATIPAGSTYLYTVDTPTVLALTPATDGSNTCLVVPVGPLSVNTITVTMTITFPDGNSATGTVLFTVSSSDPTSVSISVGPPVPIPPPSPPVASVNKPKIAGS